jgi:hypothetical protein
MRKEETKANDRVYLPERNLIYVPHSLFLIAYSSKDVAVHQAKA